MDISLAVGVLSGWILCYFIYKSIKGEVLPITHDDALSDLGIDCRGIKDLGKKR